MFENAYLCRSLGGRGKRGMKKATKQKKKSQDKREKKVNKEGSPEKKKYTVEIKRKRNSSKS